MDGFKPGEIYCISIQWSFRKYKNMEKTFTDLKHFNNWCDFIISRNGKIVG